MSSLLTESNPASPNTAEEADVLQGAPQRSQPWEGQEMSQHFMTRLKMQLQNIASRPTFLNSFGGT